MVETYPDVLNCTSYNYSQLKAQNMIFNCSSYSYKWGFRPLTRKRPSLIVRNTFKRLYWQKNEQITVRYAIRAQSHIGC
ncbi:hypothetical protein D3C73_1497240 [compost metagenome]